MSPRGAPVFPVRMFILALLIRRRAQEAVPAVASPTGIASLPRAVFAEGLLRKGKAQCQSRLQNLCPISTTLFVFRFAEPLFYYVGNETWISLTTLGLAVLITDKFEPGSRGAKVPAMAETQRAADFSLSSNSAFERKNSS